MRWLRGYVTYGNPAPAWHGYVAMANVAIAVVDVLRAEALVSS